MYDFVFVGYNVIAMICDQGSSNRSATEALVVESRGWFISNGQEPRRHIIIDEQPVIPLYDVPHLIKGIRNNLLQKDLVWCSQGETLVAKWSDIIKAYYIDMGAGDFRCIPRVSEAHVIQGKMRKMKVSCATQVLSHSMAAAITIMARNGKCYYYLSYR